MSHQASCAGYLGTHHFSDRFDNNVSVKALGFLWIAFFMSLFIMDVHLSDSFT